MAIVEYDLDTYMRLLRPAIPAVSVLGVMDERGLPVWVDESADRERMWEALANLGQEYWRAPEIRTAEIHRNAIVDVGALYHLALCGVNEEVFGYLALVVGADTAPADQREDDDFCQALRAAAACICREHRLYAELDAMAMELGERYEELNLIYSIDDKGNEGRESERALLGILEDCTRHMAGSWVSLVMPDREVDIHHGLDGGAGREREETWLQILPAVLEWLVTHKRSAVVNGGPGDSPINNLRDLPFKLIAAPITDELGEVIGAMVVGKEPTAADFVTGDRSLVDVITRRVVKALEETFDTLTGLLTRQGFERLVTPLLEARGVTAPDACVIYLGLDETTISTDREPSEATGAVLKQVANLLRCNLRDTDRVARLSDLVFAVLLEKCSLEQAHVVAEKLKTVISRREYVAGDSRFQIDLHIGIAALHQGGAGIDTLLRSAEVAAQLAEERGGSGILAYDPTDSELQRRETAIESLNLVRRALREDRFELWAQPIVALGRDLSEGHVEVLLRLRDPSGEILSPARFMPAAEAYHLMPAIDRWVIEHAMVIVEKYLAAYPDRPFHVAINLSGQSFRDTSLLPFIVEKLTQHRIPSGRLCFEVTETTAMGQMTEARTFMESLRARGCLFSLDDFGSGLSSFSYLKNLPVDFLKIDMEFVREILDDPVSAVIVDAVNRVGHVMGLRTVAEGVEDDDVKECLREMGIDYGQGYGFAMPRPIEEALDAMLSASRADGSPSVDQGQTDVVRQA